MSGRRARARAALRFALGIRRAFSKGDIFPAAGRRPPAPATGGSADPSPSGPPWRRLREETTWFTETQHALRIRGLDEPLSVLHLTDLHIRSPGPWLQALCDHLRATPPADLVLLTGDVVTIGWGEEAVCQLLDALPATRLGKWAVMGNWEYWANAGFDVWRPLLAEHGVRLMRDEWVDLGPLILAGTDDATSGQPDLDAALSGRPPGRGTIVMTHSPSLFSEIARPDVQLVLAGHSHGGQVRIPGLGAAWVPMGTGQWINGWYRRRGTQLYVSRGIGWSIAPLRAWCSPEIARIRLLPG